MQKPVGLVRGDDYNGSFPHSDIPTGIYILRLGNFLYFKRRIRYLVCVDDCGRAPGEKSESSNDLKITHFMIDVISIAKKTSDR